MSDAKQNSGRNGALHRDPEVIFTVLIGVTAALGAYTSKDWQVGARLLPQFVAWATIILAVGLIISRRRGGRQDEHRDIVDLPLNDGPDPAEFAARSRHEIAWIGGFVLACILIGFKFVLPIFLFAYLTRRAHMTVVGALVLAGIVTALMVFVIGEYVGVILASGILF